jgi:hypothetical protein
LPTLIFLIFYLLMRILTILSAATALLLASCSNNEVKTASNFCDTTCVTDTFNL